jgi:hypothetical protein
MNSVRQNQCLRLLSRLQEVYQWDNCLHLSKRGNPSNYKIKTVQTNAQPGWLCLTRDEEGNPITFLVQRRQDPRITRVRCVLDERCYEDTIIRVEYTSTSIYLADIWMWNSYKIFSATNFSYRQNFLTSVYNLLYTPCPAFESHALLLRERATDIRGYEYYMDKNGEYGVFVENTVQDDTYDIIKTDIPDVYRLSNGGYLRVQTMKLSKYLRTLGDKFKLRCLQNEDNTWTPVELSPN